MTRFYIDRHSGRRDGEFKNVLATDDEVKATVRYERLRQELRQGTVRLWDNGEIILATSAPRLRSRW